MPDKKPINYKHLSLGILLNILVVIVFILIYHAYIIVPQMRSYPCVYSGIQEDIEEIMPGE